MINSVLTYILEVIPNLTKKDVNDLDKVDLLLLRKATMTSSKSSQVLLLAEMGLLPVEYILKKKRLNYLQTLLQSEERSLSKQVWEKQIKSKTKGDFVSLVSKDLKECQINLQFGEIEKMKKERFKDLVRTAVYKACFNSYERAK